MATVREKINSLQETAEALTDAADAEKIVSRDKAIVRTGAVGIASNVMLAAFKAVIGFLSGSIAIVLDAVNNISDAASSVITIVGTKLAAKPADRKHPFGHGRTEYLTAMVIAVIVLYAGVTSLEESVKKIIHPTKPEYTAVSLVIIAAAIIVKILLGFYTEKAGQRVHSDSLVNSGKDAKLDAVISASTLVAAVIYIVAGVSLEAWLGAVISVVIIKSGIDMLRETLSELLGERADAELSKQIRQTVMSFDGVSGVYDLVLNNYGPDVYNGSLHIEVPDTFSADQVDTLTRQISLEVFRKEQVLLTAISVYSVNTKDPEVVQLRESVRKVVFSVPDVLQMHGFYLEKETKHVRLDVVISFDAPDRVATFREVLKRLEEAFPDYTFDAVLDTDYSVS